MRYFDSSQVISSFIWKREESWHFQPLSTYSTVTQIFYCLPTARVVKAQIWNFSNTDQRYPFFQFSWIPFLGTIPGIVGTYPGGPTGGPLYFRTIIISVKFCEFWDSGARRDGRGTGSQTIRIMAAPSGSTHVVAAIAMALFLRRLVVERLVELVIS